MESNIDTHSTFLVESPEIIVSDPSYSLGQGKQMIVSNIKQGNWILLVSTYTYGSGQETVQDIVGMTARHVQDVSFESVEPQFQVSVDSGMVCIFDKAHFKDGAQFMANVEFTGTERIPGLDLFTNACYRATEGGTPALLPNGCVAPISDSFCRGKCYQDKSTKEIVQIELTWSD